MRAAAAGLRVCLAVLLLMGPEARAFAALGIGVPRGLSRPLSITSAFTNQAIIAPLAGGRFISGAVRFFKRGIPFSRMVLMFRTSRIRRHGAPYDFTWGRHFLWVQHIRLSMNEGIGQVLIRQVLVGVFIFLMYENLHKVTDPIMVMLLQWGPASLVIALLWVLIQLYRLVWDTSAKPVTPTAPVTPVPSGTERYWIEKIDKVPIGIILLFMVLANLGSQVFSILAVLKAGPVSSTAANQFQGLFMWLIGFFVFQEKRFWISNLRLTLWFLAVGLMQPLISWLTGVPFDAGNFVLGILAAFSGALLAAGFKALSYRHRLFDSKVVTYLGAVAVSVVALSWISAAHSWHWNTVIHLYWVTPREVKICCFLYGMIKFYQYWFNSNQIPKAEFSQMGLAQAFSFPVNLGINRAGPPLVGAVIALLNRLFGSSYQWKFPDQNIGFWGGLIPFVFGLVGIVTALAKVDRPGLSMVRLEREGAQEFAQEQKGRTVGISGSAHTHDGPYAILAADFAIALERHGLAPFDTGGPGLPQIVRQAYSWVRGQSGRTRPLEMQSVIRRTGFQQDLFPDVEHIIRVSHTNARKWAQAEQTLGQALFPCGIGDTFEVLDVLLETMRRGKPMVMLELEGDLFWETLFDALSLRPENYGVIVRSGEEAVQALLRLAEAASPERPADLGKANRELAIYWLKIDRLNWPQAFVFAGRPGPEDSMAAHDLAEALFKREHDVRLVSRGGELWRPVLAAAKALSVVYLLQAVLHVPASQELTGLEKDVARTLPITAHSNHQVLSGRKDYGFAFFWEEGPKVVDMLNMFFDLEFQMQLGDMNHVPMFGFGVRWEPLQQFLSDRMGYSAADFPIARSVPEALDLFGVEPGPDRQAHGENAAA